MKNKYEQLCKYIDKNTTQGTDWDKTTALVYVANAVELKLVVYELEQLGWNRRGKTSISSNSFLKEGHACIIIHTSSVMTTLGTSCIWNGQYNHVFLLTLKNIETLWHLHLPVYRLKNGKGKRDKYAHLIDVNYEGDVCVNKIYPTEWAGEEENE